MFGWELRLTLEMQLQMRPQTNEMEELKIIFIQSSFYLLLNKIGMEARRREINNLTLKIKVKPERATFVVPF